MSNRKPRKQPAPDTSLKVGAKVAFTFGLDRVKGVIVEDRGPIGVDGRRLFRVRFPLRPKSEDEEHFAELPADRFKVLGNAA